MLLSLLVSDVISCSDAECRLLASSSKDGTIRIWDTILCKVSMILSGHTHCVTCVQWGGEGLLYTSSQDRTIKVWRAADVGVKSCVKVAIMCVCVRGCCVGLYRVTGIG